jgi:SAM-dependent methyltransferase
MKKIFKFILNTIPRPILIRLSIVVRPILAFLLKGSRYTDPIDGKSFRMFLPYGYGTQRNNVLSPSTLSLERHRLLWLYLQNETDFFYSELVSDSNKLVSDSNELVSDSPISKNKRIKLRDAETNSALKVLHFAPEQEFYKRFKKQKNINYTTTDLLSPLADVKADICNLPFEDNAYDIIFCNHVLEHIPDDTKAMQELYRVLKPGGMGIFQIPQDLSRATTFSDDTIIDQKERAKIFGQYDHVRVYGRDYFDKLRSIGFKVVEEDYTNKILPELVEKYCLAKGEIIPVCFK